jgi:hypothetical protein
MVNGGSVLDLGALEALISALRTGGVRRYRDGSVELELSALPPPQMASDEKPADPPSPAETAEEGLSMLLRSSGGVVPARLKERLRKVAT